MESREESSSRSRATPRSRDALLAALGFEKKPPKNLTEEVVEAARQRPLGFRYVLADGQEAGLSLRVGAQGGGVWYLTYRTGEGKKELLKLDVVPGATPKAARAAAATAKAALRRDVNPAEMKRARRAAAVEKKGKVTLRAFIEGDYWTKKLRLRKDGGSDKRRILKTWAPLLDRPLDAITSDQIERILADKRHTGGAASTLRREWGCLRNLLGYAWKSKVIPMMPVVGLPEPLVGFLHASRVRYVNERGDDEGERLFAALATREAVMDKDEDARMVVFVARLALATGMRRSEILGLRDSEIGHDVITIPGHRTKKGRVRIISLNNRARAALAMWKTRSPKGEFFPDHQDDRGWPGKSYSKWCGRLYRAWIDLCADAGIDGKTFHVHDLRHTFATRLRMVGAPLEVVRDALGHKDLASTQIYAHVGPSEVANAVALLTEE